MYLTASNEEGEILSQLPGAELSGISDEALEALEEGGMSGLTRVLSAIGLSSEDAASGLDHALRLMKVGSRYKFFARVVSCPRQLYPNGP